MDVFEQNRHLGRGVNVLGYDPIWQDRDEARMEDEHFRLIKEAGFDHVRINLHPFDHMGPADEGEAVGAYEIRPDWLATLDWAVEQALTNDLAVVLDMHEFNAMGDDPVGNRGRLMATWQQLAPRYQDAPETVLFEILNEPCRELTFELWNRYLAEAHEVIRDSNPERTLIIGPAFWNNIDYLDKLVLPEDDRKIIATVHYYRPMAFTHQGAAWSDFVDLSDVTWQGTPEEREAIRSDFARAQAWSAEHRRPLYLGEFGAYDKADMASRVRYTRFVARLAEEMDWSWAYWQFDSDFIVYDIPHDHWISQIRDALIPSEA
jgi:endoglucanase